MESKLDIFIAKAKQIYGDTYDYSSVDYVNTHTKIKIRCGIHGEFTQTPSRHLSKTHPGCAKCGTDKMAAKKRESKEIFIEKARAIHGDKYDYSITNYVNSTTKVQIICPIHGVFEMIPNSHLSKRGCSACSKILAASNATYTTEKFIEKARQVHGDKYDYSITNYVNSMSKVKILCPSHGEFEMPPSSHLSKRGCKFCARESISNTMRYTTEEFIHNARQIHGDKYDYSLVNYVNSRTKIILICPTHGNFERPPDKLLSGVGCVKCAPRSTTSKITTVEKFIEKARQIHGDKYDYSQVVFTKVTDKVCVLCTICSTAFYQKPYIHLKGCGCTNCRNIKLSAEHTGTTAAFIKKARELHGDKYDYSMVSYINAGTKVQIICNIHGVFDASPTDHFYNGGCRKCTDTVRKIKLSSNTEEFVEKAKQVHGDVYDYSLVEYNTCKDKIKLICKLHGIFDQSAGAHLMGRGCRECKK